MRACEKCSEPKTNQRQQNRQRSFPVSAFKSSLRIPLETPLLSADQKRDYTHASAGIVASKSKKLRPKAEK
jgi:hypothetical protein